MNAAPAGARRRRRASGWGGPRRGAALLSAAAGAACALLAGGGPSAWAAGGGGRRREVLAAGAAAGLGLGPRGALAAAFLPQDIGSTEAPTVKKKKVSADKLLESAYLISRVQEATVQQERLVTTGKFKDTQRNNIKMAIKMMLDNYKLEDCIVVASATLPADRSFQASQVGKEAVESLETAKEYFSAPLKVSGITEEQRQFIKDAMLATRTQLDKFLKYLPEDVVLQARRQVEEENEANMKEFASETGETAVLNPVQLPWKKA
ncbi:unnamed protein product [Prorocentrum cordatum]|uniref:ATP synthase subunit d, mitochondrial n=1 Tax=Prorocentrum cordatum TaxID=2364126 RepID=A0ABN9UKS7_9DINO|nr:unnamed protein product [Polarella glacialis]